jgi:carbamoyltransferase
MIQWGINALNHGHSIAVFQDGKFINNFIGAGDDLLSQTTVPALGYGSPNRLFWYERPWIKKARQLYAGQYRTAFDLSVLPRKNTRQFYYAPITYTPHHASHAAAGYYTSPFNHCAIVVLDAIGEFECATIWEGLHGEMRKVWSRSYPHSLGLFYSAFTKLIGLTPIKDEFLLQQMAEQGDPTRFRRQVAKYFGPNTLRLEYNFHRGVLNWPSEPVNLLEQCDIAAAVQERFETEIGSIMRLAASLTNADSLVYMGGCAMNSRANQREVEPVFKYRWSLPNPGDPSSSIGAVLYHTRQRVWDYRWDPVKHLAINI